MNIADRVTVRQLFAAFATTGTKPPRAVSDAHARATKLVDKVRSLGAGEDALSLAVAAAIDAGNDPTADPAVQRALVASQIANPGIVQAVDAIAFDHFRDVCKTHADDIVIAWRKPFDQAVAALSQAHGRLGAVNLSDTAAIVQMGGNAVEVWASAQAAEQTIEATVAGWSGLGTFTGLAPLAPRYRVLRLAAVVDFEVWRTTNPGLTPWEAVLAGFTLDLPSFTGYRERVEAIEEQARLAADQQRPVDRARSHVAGHEIRVP